MRKGFCIGIAIVVGARAPASALGKTKTKPKHKRLLPDLRITKIEVPDWEPFALDPKAANATVLQDQYSGSGTMTQWIWDLRAMIR